MRKLEQAREWGSTILLSALAGNLTAGFLLFFGLTLLSLLDEYPVAPWEIGEVFLLIAMVTFYGTVLSLPFLLLLGVPLAFMLRKQSGKSWTWILGAALGATVGALAVRLLFIDNLLTILLGGLYGALVGVAWTKFATLNFGQTHSPAE